MKTLSKTITWLTLFSIAMGFMETAVVVYLRKIYYPNGFDFPLVPINPDIALVEFWREAATIIMLAGIGILAGKNASQKFSFFIYCFAIWDIFYYIFLKVLIDWPASLLTWDILFLIPVSWVGPVLAPCIVSATMIILTLCVVYLHEKGYDTHINRKEWIFFSSGSLIIILSFIWDYIKYINNGNSAKHIWTLSSKESLFNEIASYVPTTYNWWLFSAGELIIIYTVVSLIRRVINSRNITTFV